ncbi:MAG: low-specificity L-threonine aldolase [Pseudomonadota bacterium]
MQLQPDLDFRSDTVTKPCAGMRAAMARAEVGDDYYRDDPTVEELERYAADLFEKEAALLTTSGTQSNLVAIMAHCQRGDAHLVGSRSHSYNQELGGVAMVAGVQPQVVPNRNDGTLHAEDIRASLLPASILHAHPRLIALENTIDGMVLPLDYLDGIAELAGAHRLKIHIDGARIFNAATALDVSVAEIAKHGDSVSFCLSKGLGAPVGSVLVGSHELIEKARRHRQMLGGGMRQAGILAAAGLYALQHNVSRLKTDHARADTLASALSSIPGLKVDPPQTNIVFSDVDTAMQDSVAAYLQENGIRVSGKPDRLRWVTHLGLDDAVLNQTLTLLSRMPEALHAH